MKKMSLTVLLIVISILLSLSTEALVIRTSKQLVDIMKDRKYVNLCGFFSRLY